MGITNAPNIGLRGANVGHSSQPSKGPSYTDGRIAGSNPTNRFAVADSKMPQPPSAVAPGKGAVPVNPWDTNGRPAQAATEPDDAPIARPPGMK